MKTYALTENQHAGNGTSRSTSKSSDFADLRPAAFAQRKLAGIVDTNGRTMQQKALMDLATNSLLQRKTEMDEEEPKQAKFTDAVIAQREAKGSGQSNKTGLSDSLKSGIESLSGLSMDHVRVHYNSPQPAQMNAHAYAQGSDIHVASGQEQHVPHEAWHVVQQAQGRVKPTRQLMENTPINDDKALEDEADKMGAKASQQKASGIASDSRSPSISGPVQRMIQFHLPPNGEADTKNYYNAQGNAKNLVYGGGRPADFSTKFKANMVEHQWGGSYNKETDMWHVATSGASQVVLPTNAIQIDHVVPWNNIETELSKNPSGVYTSPNLTTLKNAGYINPAGNKYTMYAARMYYHDVGNLKPMAGSENAAKGASDAAGGQKLKLAWMNRAARSTGLHHQLVTTAFQELLNWQSDGAAVAELLAKFDEVDDSMIEAEEFFKGF